MNVESIISSLYVFSLAAFLGYQVISKVPPLLHTPLMSYLFSPSTPLEFFQFTRSVILR